MFDNERQAVVQLELVVASGVPEAGVAQTAIDTLVEADRQLAQMAAAAADVAAGNFNEAVNHYKTAWDTSTKAL